VSVINLRNIPEDLHRRIKSEAALRGLSLRKFIIQILEEYLDRLDKGKKKRR